MDFDFTAIEGFEWDAGNLAKNAQKHGITPDEAEEIFFRTPWVADDTRSEDKELRWAAIGQTERGRVLRILFTIRRRRIRPISCRPASRNERTAYEKALRQRR